MTINELILGVNLALGVDDVERCPSFDRGGTGRVTVVDLVVAVRNALDGCAPLATPTATQPVATATQTPQPVENRCAV